MVAVTRNGGEEGPGRARLALLLFLATTLIGLLNFAIVMTSWRAEGSDNPARLAFLWEMTGAYAFLLVLPGLLAVMRRFPFTKGSWLRVLPVHLAAFVAAGVTQTLLMWGSRSLLYRGLGWGSYHYGDMRYRFFMEGGKQLLGYVFVLVIVSLAASLRRARERELTAANLGRELTEARLATLKTQLEPHFLFNTLNMISAHVREDPDRAEAMITHLSDFLRATLRSQGAQEVPLERELELLDAYLEIMRARFEERLAVEVDVPAALRSALVPHLVLQPLVENAVTHAVRDSARGWVRIAAARVGDRLRLTVEDDGPGLRGDVRAEPGRGLGLSNTSERLRHLHGNGQRLTLANRPEGGLRVEVEVPYRTAPAAEREAR